MNQMAFADTAAVRALAKRGEGSLCTIVAIEGSYSRRLGAQLAIFSDGSIAGSLADGCLEAQLVREAQEASTSRKARLLRFGKGSMMMDFQLPCGSRIDIVVDPLPDMGNITKVISDLDRRRPSHLLIIADQMDEPFQRIYRPELRLVILGTGPECEMLHRQAEAFGTYPEWLTPRDQSGGHLALGQQPDIILDHWTAVALLFHDHEWEYALLPWALASDAFYVGAQGGATAREQRLEMLKKAGLHNEQLKRLRAPVGVIPHSRDPSVLALSILAEIVAEYEAIS